MFKTALKTYGRVSRPMKHIMTSPKYTNVINMKKFYSSISMNTIQSHMSKKEFSQVEDLLDNWSHDVLKAGRSKSEPLNDENLLQILSYVHEIDKSGYNLQKFNLHRAYIFVLSFVSDLNIGVNIADNALKFCANSKPILPVFHYNKARFLQQLGRIPECKNEYRAAIKINDGLLTQDSEHHIIGSYFQLGLLEKNPQLMEQAIDHLEVQEGYQNSEEQLIFYLTELGAVQMELSQFVEARINLEKAFIASEFRKEHLSVDRITRAPFLLSQYYSATRNYKKQLHILKRLQMVLNGVRRNLEKDQQIYMLDSAIGEAKLMLGDTKQAFFIFKKLTNDATPSGLLNREVGKVHFFFALTLKAMKNPFEKHLLKAKKIFEESGDKQFLEICNEALQTVEKVKATATMTSSTSNDMNTNPATNNNNNSNPDTSNQGISNSTTS